MVTVIGYLSTLFGTTFAFFTTARDLNHLMTTRKKYEEEQKRRRRRKKNFFQARELGRCADSGPINL
jgi:hypothetical protein